MASSLLASGKKVFLPTKHLWMRATKQHASSTKYPFRVDIGISRRGLQDIGDVSAMTPATALTTANKQVLASQDLLYINWDAHTITSADELYHTVWETISETTTLQAPIAGTIAHFNIISPDEEELDDDMVLVTMNTNADALAFQANDWMEENDYEDFVQSISPGKFE